MEEKGLTLETRKFFRNLKRDEFIDDYEFDIWKKELQKDLSQFWESIIQN